MIEWTATTSIGLVQTGLLGAILYRLGSLTERIESVEEYAQTNRERLKNAD